MIDMEQTAIEFEQPNPLLERAANGHAAPAPAAPSPEARMAAMLLRMADKYKLSGGIRQATDMYFEVLEKYGEVPESAPARERLMDIAEWYESKGELRQARALGERLFSL